MMLAYVARFDDEWCMLIHGETPGKAKSSFLVCEPSGDAEFIDIRLRRLPGLDNKPITYENAKEAGFEYYDDYMGENISPEDFINDCACEICTRPAHT